MDLEDILEVAAEELLGKTVAWIVKAGASALLAPAQEEAPDEDTLAAWAGHRDRLLKEVDRLSSVQGAQVRQKALVLEASKRGEVEWTMYVPARTAGAFLDTFFAADSSFDYTLYEDADAPSRGRTFGRDDLLETYDAMIRLAESVLPA